MSERDQKAVEHKSMLSHKREHQSSESGHEDNSDEPSYNR